MMLSIQSALVNTNNDVAVWQIPADGCHGRCDDHYESGKQEVCFAELLAV